MTHPGLNSPRLADMRAVLDEVALSNNERYQIESALSEIEADWENQRRTAYDHALGVRDDQHDEVIQVAGEFDALLAERYDDVRHGRCSPQEARAWLRDVRADFDVLTRQHRGIETSEDRLEAMESQSVDTYQAERLARLSTLGASSPTLMTKIAESIREQERRSVNQSVQHRSKEEIDAEQDALARALRRRS